MSGEAINCWSTWKDGGRPVAEFADALARVREFVRGAHARALAAITETETERRRKLRMARTG
jgi:hypothetical protein